ncbi:hypothetical protein K491DRAFT_685585 [Lophiostoma macrostomum CBS 122681]|uniref:GIY-YIG domain-containing protein n=1 Tax=Lophiostoma macrostomum CBS 122681 TaxID=1314788 RepID=A0A6A6SL52_9PLEO|nr:hypothetical protein K491DRAFT_685585 [Lophiostoma macrostomum CBS 122681]
MAATKRSWRIRMTVDESDVDASGGTFAEQEYPSRATKRLQRANNDTVYAEVATKPAIKDENDALAVFGDEESLQEDTDREERKLVKRMERYDRYATLVSSSKNETEVRVRTILRPGISAWFESRKLFNLESLRKLSLSRPLDAPNRAGIYLHVVVVDGEARFYVGQAIVLRDRIRTHNAKGTWSLGDSLHYKGVIKCKENGEEDFWIILAEKNLPEIKTDSFSLELNIAEMLCSMIFQSLPQELLRKWLPKDSHLVAEKHLNVASPLQQGLRQAVRDVRYLRDSADPILREYYESVRAIWTRNLDYHREQRGNETRERALQGYKVALTVYMNTNPYGKKFQRTVVKLRDVVLTVPSNLQIIPDDVYVFYDLQEGAHPDRAAQQAQEDDPAYRLGIRISGKSRSGDEVTHWLKTKGAKDVARINSLCDWLAGREKEVTESTPRRFFIKKSSRGPGKQTYTT